MKSYPLVIKLIHWITLVLILGSLSSSFFMYKADGNLDNSIINAHAVNGSTILLLTLVRFFYRAKYGVPPVSMGTKYQIMIAGIVHKSFYVVILSIIFCGLVSFVTRKLIINYQFKELVFGAFKISLYKIVDISSNLHSMFVFIFLLLLFAHISGFIYHQFIDKKNLIKKMWFGS